MAYSIETLASTRRKRKENSRVESLIPSGLRDKSVALIELLKSYYDYMNLSGNPSYEINSINNARDIDLVDEKYLTLLQKEIAAAIPKNVQIDKVKLYKSLLQYYSVRGSVDSIRLFFKILFQDNVQIYYPREDMLIPSSGNWDPNALRPNYSGNTLTGYSSGGYADNKGFLSDTIKLQDSYFYQQFSYVIQTGNNTDTWKNEFNRLVHPAGFIFFGQIVIFIENVNAFPVDIIQDLDLWLSGYQKVNGVTVPLTLEKLNIKLLDIIDGRDDVRIYSSMHTHQPGLISDEDLPVPVFVGFAESLTDGISGEPFSRKERCVAATTANITLSAPQTIDGLAVIAGDRVLVKNQTTTSENGIYQVNAGAWTRTTDADTRDELVSAFVFIPHGSVQNRNTAWVCTIGAGAIDTATMIWNESFVIPQAMIPFPKKAATGGGATATATVSGGLVTGLTVSYLTPSENASYTHVPSVVFSGGGGTGAAATATLLNGVVTGLTITNPGSGYSGVPAVTIATGTDSTTYLRSLFTGAILRSPHKLGVMTAVYDSTVFRGTHFTLLFDQIPIVPANSAHREMLVKRYQSIAHFFDPGTEMHSYANYTIEQADSTDINNQIPWGNVGSLISNAATFTGSIASTTLTVTAITEGTIHIGSTIFTPDVSGTVIIIPQTTVTAQITGSNRAVSAVTVTSVGTGYTSVPTVTISGGGGSGATATSTIFNGAISKLTITSAGSGYTSTPTVTISGGGGSGATATAIASGGIGTYTVSNSQTVASITMTAITPFSAF